MSEDSDQLWMTELGLQLGMDIVEVNAKSRVWKAHYYAYYTIKAREAKQKAAKQNQ